MASETALSGWMTRPCPSSQDVHVEAIPVTDRARSGRMILGLRKAVGIMMSVHVMFIHLSDSLAYVEDAESVGWRGRSELHWLKSGHRPTW